MRCCVVVLCIVASACVIRAQTTSVHAQLPDSYEFWPELHVYYRLSSSERLFFNISPTRERDVGIRDVQVGANIDFGLIPFIRGLTDTSYNHSPNFRYLRLRAGIRYFFGVDPTLPYQEWRGVIELTPAFPIGNIGILYFRNRLDLRWLEGEYSTRYRGRLQFEKQFNPFGAGNVSLTPFGSAEMTFDSRASGIARMRYQLGVSIGVSSMLAIEPTANYQENIFPSEQNVYALGLVLVFYF